jgi:S-formylglutathione hydrolase FrmB
VPISQGPARLRRDQLADGHHGRLHLLTLSSPALGGATHVYVLLPKQHTTASRRRFHVLYLLHGASDDYRSWVQNGAQQLIERATRKTHEPFITVMPDAGYFGFYTDWYGTDVDQSEGVAPAWSTYDIHELIPLIDSRYRTVARRGGRAVAGFSMGGFGATSLAARDPGLFSVVGTFSGIVDTDLDSPTFNLLVDGLSPTFTGTPPDLCVFGDPLTHQIGWEASDPAYLAPDLKRTGLYVTTGNGVPGPLDSTAPADLPYTTERAAIEALISVTNQGFLKSLNAAQVTHTTDLYGAGTHTWAYWQRDLSRFVPFLARSWRHPDPAPRSFNDRNAATSFQAWGWHFTAQRAVEEFTYLRDVSKRGLQVAGSGTLHVVTAADYSPGSHWRVAGHAATAGPGGRLRFAITMPDHTVQQTSFPAGSAIPSGWHWVEVGIRPATAN